MKVFALLALLAVAVVAKIVDLEAPAINENIIAKVNADPSSTWAAGRNERLEGLSLKDFSKLLGAKKSAKNAKLPMQEQHSIHMGASIPTTFDSRQNWPGCIGPVLDQGHCGSCWAFGAVESLSDRFCIQTKGATNVSLSEQLLVSCDRTNTGCNGGESISAWKYLQSSGTVTSDCYPYDMGSCHHPGCSEWNTPTCNKTCQNGDPYSEHTYKAKSAYSIPKKVSAIQTEIMTNGPVEVAFDVYEDFATYTSGVYIHKSGNYLGGHAVKNIGWGVLNGTAYWLIQNSWNPSWGMDGYFLILRGSNECGIEADVVAGLAATN